MQQGRLKPGHKSCHFSNAAKDVFQGRRWSAILMFNIDNLVQYWRSGVECSTDLALDSSLASIAACVIVQPTCVPLSMAWPSHIPRLPLTSSNPHSTDCLFTVSMRAVSGTFTVLHSPRIAVGAISGYLPFHPGVLNLCKVDEQKWQIFCLKCARLVNKSGTYSVWNVQG